MGKSYTYHNPEKVCPHCNGTGKIRVTNSVKVNYREYSDSYVEECGECNGTGMESYHWLTKDEYNRLVELDRRYDDLKSGRYVPSPKKKRGWIFYLLVGLAAGVLISKGNILLWALFFAFLGLASSKK